MRIISQDKKWDTPYEKVTIRVHADTSLILASEVGGNSEFPIGSYETQERALEVMREIRTYYSKIKNSEFMGKEDEWFTDPIFVMPKE